MPSLLKVVLIGLLIFPYQAYSHGGGLNAEGCHNNRKTGDYHCHRAPQASSYLTRDATSSPLGSTGWAYPNCAAARAAGAAPVYMDESGYGPHLDRDNDGKGCE